MQPQNGEFKASNESLSPIMIEDNFNKNNLTTHSFKEEMNLFSKSNEIFLGSKRFNKELVSSEVLENLNTKP